MKALHSVLIVEPSDIVIEGLSSFLNDSDDYNVLSPMHDTLSLEERLPVIRPDMLIINPVIMGQGIKAVYHMAVKQQLSNIMRQRPNMPIIAVNYQYVEPSLLEAFRYVIDIRMSRSAIATLLTSAIDNQQKEDDTGVEKEDNYELSDRETDVLILVAKGLSSKEIADTLNISVHTVNSHRKNITHKTGIKSVAGLAVYAMLHNLIEE